MAAIQSPEFLSSLQLDRQNMHHESTRASSIIPEIATVAIPEDERLWVPQAENVWFRPLLLNRVNGEWVNLLRVTRAGILSRHRHPAPVHGFVIKGSWRYLEHDWVAHTGMYVFEPPGEVQTLIVDDDVDEMITLFHVCGALIYYDEQGRPTGHDDVHTKIELCRRHFAKVGLGEQFVEQFIR
jgi:quercetin dioxygenase-like cupin family protein